VRQFGQLKLHRDGAKVPVSVFQLPAQANAAGGPIVNAAGELLGIQSAADAPAGVGYAASLPETRRFVAAVPVAKLRAFAHSFAAEFGSLPKALSHVAADADTALSLNPDHLAARLKRAETSLMTEKFADALADLDRITERRPQFAAALRLRAAARLAKADPKAAQADVQRVLEFDPADADVRLLSARAYAAAGEEPKAVLEFANVLRLAPGRLTDVLLAIGRHADHLDQKGLTTGGDWLIAALTAVAKVLPKSEVAASLKSLPVDPTVRARQLRSLCGEGK
jgi:tetratricopeptide (TPR) repeat protein